jgi:hypothetical protein
MNMHTSNDQSTVDARTELEEDDDPIVAEVHRIREEHFASLGCNIDRLFEEVMLSQQCHGEKLVSFNKKDPNRTP